MVSTTITTITTRSVHINNFWKVPSDFVPGNRTGCGKLRDKKGQWLLKPGNAFPGLGQAQRNSESGPSESKRVKNSIQICMYQQRIKSIVARHIALQMLSLLLWSINYHHTSDTKEDHLRWIQLVLTYPHPPCPAVPPSLSFFLSFLFYVLGLFVFLSLYLCIFLAVQDSSIGNIVSH